MSADSHTFTSQQVDALIREIGNHGDVLAEIAQEISVWGSIDRQSFREIFMETGHAEILPEIARDWS